MTVRFHGRNVDPVSLWSDYVEFPPNFDPGDDEFAPLVRCPNPDHHTEKRHFQVNLKKDLVHCFAGCGISGTYEHAISMIEGTTQREARRRILRSSTIGTLDRGSKRHRSDPVTSQQVIDVRYEKYLPPVALEYLKSRGISSETVAKWELGWNADTLRIVIPARDHHRHLKFLIQRTVKPGVEPRYLYPAGSERNKMLFGSCVIDPGMVRSFGMVLVEGSVDVMVMHQHGFVTTVGILGSKLSEIQAKQIMNMRPKRIYTMFDADGAGVEATFSVRRRISKIPISVCRYPKGKTDPAELKSEEAKRMLERAIPFSIFSANVLHRSPKSKERM